ncbi:MAG: FkbM family methyltransferase [bacterium]|nr:FkbM family methyltransferase [bacterium]
MKIIKQLSDIPQWERTAIFGAGQAGLNFLKILRAFRFDLGIECFIDSFKQGGVESIPVMDLDRFLASYGPLDKAPFILIASMAWREIEALLIDKHIHRYLIIPPRFIVPSGFGNLHRNKSIDPLVNTLSHDLFTLEDRERFAGELKAACDLLETDNDKRLFRILTGDFGSRIDAVTEFFYRGELNRQYFDFIDYGKIQTVIEGGVADGGDTAAFIDAIKPGSRVYGFEPNIDGYHRGIYKDKLQANPGVKIIPKGLWSSTTRLYFKAAGLSSRFSEKKPDDLTGWESVEVVSIDEFVGEEGIGKVDFIKMDIEGAELEALKGALKTLREHRPQLAICIYHNKEQFVRVPLFLNENLENYRFRIGHYTSGSLETVWYGIPG